MNLARIANVSGIEVFTALFQLLIKSLFFQNHPLVGFTWCWRIVIEDIANNAVNLPFNSRAGQIAHSVDNCSPPPRRFLEAVLSRR